ncbi:O-antigen ligase family protein [Rhizobium sp. RU35A]|uniref:O-antigen ligase family protein n=1 Tax=Rhizobium sp. RU35A TaxID=1907414 RepID=UPI00122C6B6B|nr:O-antigen ligase family protein [Rhizobium sp. RU35A]
MMTVKRLLLLRRRIDPLLVGLSAVLFPLYMPAPVAVAVIFGACGLYVAFSSRRRLRRQMTSPAGMVMVYTLFSAALMLVRGEFNLDNRQLGFMGLLLGVSFISPGLCLVRRPLRHFVIGARLGSVATFLLALTVAMILAHAPDRYGGGGNAAIMAFLVLIGALVASIDLEKPPRFLPNGMQYLALSSFPVFLTETRAVLVLVPTIFLVEFFCRTEQWRPHLRKTRFVMLLAGLVALLLLPQVREMLIERFFSVYDYYIDGGEHADMVSGDIRLTMWQAALVVIGDHLVSGVGLMRMFGLMTEAAGDHASLIEGYKHVHNFVLQELLANGVIGLLLLASIPVVFLATVWRKTPDAVLRRSAVYVLGSLGAFGLLHDPFYHELCLSTIMLFVGVCLAQFHRWDMLTPAAAKRL